MNILLALLLVVCQSEHSAHGDPAMYTLPAGKTTARIPMQFVASKVHLDATIDGKGPFHLILDTGMPIAGVLLFRNPGVEALGLADSGAHVRVAGAGGDGKGSDAVMATGVALALGELKIAGTSALLVPLPEGFPPGIDGVIGGALFFHYVVRIDVEHARVDLFESKGWTAPVGACSVPLLRENGKIFVDLRVAVGAGEPVPARVVVDSGASHALSLNTRADGTFAPPAKTIEAPLGRGLSGILLGKEGRVRRLEFGSFAFDEVLTSFPVAAHQQPGGEQFHDGNLGMGVLLRFVATFDYAGERLLLEKAAGFDAAFETEMAGLALDWSKDGAVLVHSVLAGSPAAGAGIEAGDRLLSIDGHTIAELGEQGLHAALRQEGAELKLVLQRGEQKLERNLRLKRLV